MAAQPTLHAGRKRPSLPEAREPTNSSPTLRRRELGALLRVLRNERGLTVEQVAERLLCSPSKVSRMETGQRGATPRDVRDLCDLYEVVDLEERARFARLAAEGKQQGWWQGYELDYFATYVGLEEEAIATKNFQSTTVPGLLQTADYARAMHLAGVPEFTTERIDQLIQVRLTRQRALTRDRPLQLWSVLDEPVLHRLVGGYRVMRDQLQRMIDATQLPNVTIQIIPFSAGAHAAMESSFDILEFGAVVPNLVYVEGLVGYMYLERSQDLHRYEQVFERLRDIALSPQESIELMAETAARYDRAAVPAEHDAGSAK
jgi:transcriptional regulator with XRE-family HTH domain